jgi:tRNA-2-methylthio-N6-dimethylallyladenosine synthase
MDDGADLAPIATSRNVMPFLHLPVQSGSDRVLEAMNRGHKADMYIRICDELSEARPDIALSSDFIVGHPGEKPEDHEATMKLMERVGFALAYLLQVLAASWHARRWPAHIQVAEAIKDRAAAGGAGPAAHQQAAFNESCVGQECEVLFTNPGRHPGQVMGRTPWLQPVHARARIFP